MDKKKITEIKTDNNSITETKKIINTLSANIECTCRSISEICTMFKAMRYGIAEGAVSDEEADECLSGFQSVLDNVLLDAESAYSLSEDFLGEVM